MERSNGAYKNIFNEHKNIKIQLRSPYNINTIGNQAEPINKFNKFPSHQEKSVAIN